MAYTLLNPPYSFLQFGYAQFIGQKHCYEHDIKNCLPVIENTDLAFQLILKAGNEDEADAICDAPTNIIQLLLLEGIITQPAGFEAAILKNFTIDDGLLFQRYRINDTEILFYWPHGLPGFKDLIDCNSCFQIGIKIVSADPVINISAPTNCFYRPCDDCWTSLLEYNCDENSYGFEYCQAVTPNKVRLPIHIARPQLKTEQSIYSRSNGKINILKAVKKKEYEAETENLTEDIHEKIDIALDHDEVHITSKHYTGGIRKTGDYEIEWIKFLDYPLGKAQFKVLVTPYLVRNDNCEVCEPLPQIDAVDDVFPDDLLIGEEYEIDVKANDTFCCSPVTFSIVSFNETYLESANINDDGILTIVVKADAPDEDNVELVVYKAECPNGIFDTAIVRGNVEDGETDLCAAPTDLSVDEVTETTASLSWTRVLPTPAGLYDWELYDDDNNLIASDTGVWNPGSTILIVINGLDANTHYDFRVRSNCGEGNYSTWVTDDFTTLPPPGNITPTCAGGSTEGVDFGVAGTYNFSQNIVTVTPGVIHVVAHNDQAGSISGYSMYYSGDIIVGPGQTSIVIPVEYDGGGIHTIFTMTFTYTDTSGESSCESLFSFN
ncbi:MAG: fibronectin type III domain-containing protein [Chitinophagaceae bacterium]|nr:fibronectin type III domain-containing protein [Chitinophagaceae bacterium]